MQPAFQKSTASLLSKLLSALPSCRAAGVHAVDKEKRRGEGRRGTRGKERGGNERRGEINVQVSKRALQTKAGSI